MAARQWGQRESHVLLQWISASDAIRSGETEVVKLLLDRDVNVNQWNSSGSTACRTALEAAISKDNVEITTLLLNRGDQCSARFKDHRTPLMLAAYYGSIKVATLLLDSRGVNVNETNEGQQTALMFAARRGKADVAKLLLERGANRKIVAKGGKTARTSPEGSHQYCRPPDISKILGLAYEIKERCGLINIFE